VALDVALGDGEGIAAQVRGLHAGVGPAHRGEHRQAAVAGAQVEHARRRRRQPGADRAVDERLGNERARHDHACVDNERHPVQPGLAGEVGGRHALGDPTLDQRLDGTLLGSGDRPRCRVGGRIERVERIERQAESPQHQPGRLVERVVGAVAEGDACALESRRHALDQLAERRCRRHASSVSSTRR
jgi:hypothetical protein